MRLTPQLAILMLSWAGLLSQAIQQVDAIRLVSISASTSSVGAAISEAFQRADCLQDEFTYANDTSCRCHQFQSSPAKKFGVFKSPQHPEPYPLELPCLLYVFVADEGEIVQLQFEEFSMKPASNNGRCVDFVRLFLDSPRAELSPADKPNYELCGSQLPQKEFYSSTRVLMLELHSRVSPPYETVQIYSGFRGAFHFQKEDQFKSDGQHMLNSACDYQFWSTDQLKTGRFFSPGHPQNYRPGVACTFYFRALGNERVRVDLERLSLGGPGNDSRCRDAAPWEQDQVLVFDSERDDAGMLARFSTFCRAGPREQVVSPGAFLRVKFAANGDAVTGSGFSGRFAFVTRHKLQPTRPMDAAAVALATGKGLPAPKPQMFERSHHFYSSRGKEGAFSTPEFPNPYPPMSRVVYKFVGEPGETVRVSFVTFKLDETTSDCSLDYSGDRLLIFDGYSADFSSRVVTRCGDRPGDDFWSTGHHLTLEFRSDGVTGAGERGFTGSFNFFRRSQPDKATSSSAAAAAASSASPGSQAEEGSNSDDGDLGTPCPPEPVLISGSGSPVGLVRTPDYPVGYRRGLCIWELVGTANRTERVVLELRHLDLEPPPPSMASGATPGSQNCGDRVMVTKYLDGELGRVEAAPPLIYCRVSRSQPVRLMSSSRPRLRVSFNATAASKVRSGLEFAYRFVQDFGVHGEFKNQNQSGGCYFEFHSWQSSWGSFTSPNYPYAYPEKLTCHYVFHAGPGERIRIEFTNYETESSRLCLPGDSDYVLAEECDRPNYRLQTFCGKPEPGTAFSLSRQVSCLRLIFVSNNQYSAAGFRANYFFERRTTGIVFSQINNSAEKSHPSCLWPNLVNRLTLAAAVTLLAFLCQTL